MAHHAANLAVWWVFAAKSYGPVGRKTGGFHIFPEAFDEDLKKGLMPDGVESYARAIRKGGGKRPAHAFCKQKISAPEVSYISCKMKVSEAVSYPYTGPFAEPRMNWLRRTFLPFAVAGMTAGRKGGERAFTASNYERPHCIDAPPYTSNKPVAVQERGLAE